MNVKDVLEGINRWNGGENIQLLKKEELGMEGRAVVRVLLHSIESWMGASLKELQITEFGHDYSEDFKAY
eukprot:CAMPEP_0118646938 /NCGR_PEP_ID=MMETSP0785-20121206/8335_1 /TAXON_ID=91992 /ORGANISM="Bolidomonas pacifica, Strain CCMP 1866" /LENGTH=69 /DNA_ID=CAMNT_0006538989 /DNA_START=498 /DNA_END=704 /DNA_ORIENTATION=+